jgi:hypothetical protein
VNTSSYILQKVCACCYVQFTLFIELYLTAQNTELNVGNVCITWFGTTPRVVIAEPELVKDILSNKFGHFEKFTLKSLGKLIALGLASYEGEKWARHRRILNPAFHLEKLKVHTVYVSCYKLAGSDLYLNTCVCACMLTELNLMFSAHVAGFLDVLQRDDRPLGQ